MKKAIVTTLAVAIIGALGVYSKSNGTPQSAITTNSATSPTAPASTTNSGSSTALTSGTSSTGSFKDGTYKGVAEDNGYGTVQIAVVVSDGKISDVQFLSMPSDQGHSREITQYSEPLLKQTTLQKQSANIDFVSGATSTSEAYRISLQSALDRAV